MEYTERYKEGFNKVIEKELNKCEIIYNPNTKGIWFINRERKYWFLEYKIESHYLWWRYDYFKKIKTMLAMNGEVFKLFICEWVENKLNSKVLTTEFHNVSQISEVEDTLNCKVLLTKDNRLRASVLVEDTLNCKVISTDIVDKLVPNSLVEETLNCKVLSTDSDVCAYVNKVEDTLNCKVDTTGTTISSLWDLVEETLNCKVLSTGSRMGKGGG